MLESNEFNTDIGQRIRNVRESLGKTREQIAEAAGMSAKTIVNLAKALNVSTDYLLLGHEEYSAMPGAAAISNIAKILAGLSLDKLNLAEKFIADFSNGARKK